MNWGLPFAVIAVLALAGCGEPKRDNPLDPKVSEGVDLREELIGSWGREDAEANEVYTFKVGGQVELRNFSAPDGGAVDRNASFPQTLVITFAGTYDLTGSALYLSFTQVQTNEPGGRLPSLPSRGKEVVISIKSDALTMQEGTSKRLYHRL